MPAPAVAAKPALAEPLVETPQAPPVKKPSKARVMAKTFPLQAHRHGVLILPGTPVEIDLDHWVQVQLDAGILVEV